MKKGPETHRLSICSCCWSSGRLCCRLSSVSDWRLESSVSCTACLSLDAFFQALCECRLQARAVQTTLRELITQLLHKEAVRKKLLTLEQSRMYIHFGALSTGQSPPTKDPSSIEVRCSCRVSWAFSVGGGAGG